MRRLPKGRKRASESRLKTPGSASPAAYTRRGAADTSSRARLVAALRRRLPGVDEEPAGRAGLAGAPSLFLLAIGIAVLVPLRARLDTGSIALVLLLPPLVA